MKKIYLKKVLLKLIAHVCILELFLWWQILLTRVFSGAPYSALHLSLFLLRRA